MRRSGSMKTGRRRRDSSCVEVNAIERVQCRREFEVAGTDDRLSPCEYVDRCRRGMKEWTPAEGVETGFGGLRRKETDRTDKTNAEKGRRKFFLAIFKRHREDPPSGHPTFFFSLLFCVRVTDISHHRDTLNCRVAAQLLISITENTAICIDPVQFSNVAVACTTLQHGPRAAAWIMLMWS